MPEPAPKTKQEMSLDDLREAVWRALAAATPADLPPPCIVQCFTDHVIVSSGGAYADHDFKVNDDGTVTLAEGKKVEPKFVPVKQAVSLSVGRIAQAADPSKFDIVVIREGFARGDLAGNPYVIDGRPLYWTKQALETGVEVYEGAAVTAFRFGQKFGHLDDEAGALKGLATLNEIGRLSGVHVAQAADGLHELRATLTLLKGVDELVPSILQSWADESIPEAERGGFSIEAKAEFLPGVIGGKAVTQGVRILRNPDGTSLDMVSHPAAGGRVRKVAASIRGVAPKETSMPEPVATPAPDANAEGEKVKQGLEKIDQGLARMAEKEKALNIRETAAKVAQAAKDAGLPEKAQGLVCDFFDGAEAFDEAKVKAKIDKVRQSISGTPSVTGAGLDVSVGLESRDKLELEIEGLLSRSSDPEWASKTADGRPIRQALREAGLDKPHSFLAHYRKRTGQDFAGLKGMSKDSRRRVLQSIGTSTYGDAFENVINRRFLTFFENPEYSDWRRICSNIIQLPNYVKQERITVGSYANPPVVPEGANYVEATTPGDTGNGYTPVKYGFTESITEEAFLRDDVGILSSVPKRMGTAMARLVYETVFDIVKPSTTGTMDYDGETLYDTDHDVNQNKGTTALSGTEFIVVAKAMMKFTDQTASKRMGLRPKLILVPIDLANTAWDIFKPLASYPGGSTTDNAWLREFGVEVIVVRHWTDATDWAVGADPTNAPGVEVGFVGSETPEFFVQDNATLGSVFDADKVTYKSKIALGGNVGRHESWYGEVVGG